MYYTIIWHNTYKNEEIISWMGKTFKTYEEASNSAKDECYELWEEMPSLSYTIHMHRNFWTELLPI